MSDNAGRIAEALRATRNLPLFMTQAEAALDYAFQPIVDIHSGEVFGYEALLREFERLGSAHPGTFSTMPRKTTGLPNWKACSGARRSPSLPAWAFRKKPSCS